MVLPWVTRLSHLRLGATVCSRADEGVQQTIENPNQVVECMKHIHEEAQAALSKAQDEMKCYADQHQGDVPEYQVSQKVWVETNNIDLKWP